MTKLVIDRKIWFRGNGEEESKLLREVDDRMCCVGIYLKSCGVPPGFLLEQNIVTDTWDGPGARALYEHPAVPDWIKKAGSVTDVNALYAENDMIYTATPEFRREARIREIFAKHDVEVVFIN